MLLLLLLYYCCAAQMQVLLAVDKAADGSVTRSEHGPLTSRIAPLTAVHDDNVDC
jgi:hypothetical protein